MIPADSPVAVLPVTPEDRDWLRSFILDRWDAPFIVSHGRKHFPVEHSGFKAMIEGRPAGVLTYEIELEYLWPKSQA